MRRKKFLRRLPVAHAAILATQEAEIRRITVGDKLCWFFKTLSRKITSQKRAGGVAQGVGSEFKPQNHQQKEKKRKKKILYMYPHSYMLLFVVLIIPLHEQSEKFVFYHYFLLVIEF
jgi:hypothetical protein